MRRAAFGCSMAVAALAWTWSALAQTPTAAPATGEDVYRLAEINVELAWLADPVTFPYALAARFNNNKMEALGSVPKGPRVQAGRRQGLDGRAHRAEFGRLAARVLERRVCVGVDELALGDVGVRPLDQQARVLAGEQRAGERKK